MSGKQELQRTILLNATELIRPIYDDLQALTPIVTEEVDRFKRGELSVEKVFFWQKSLARAFFALVDVLCSALCQSVIDYAERLEVPLSRGKRKELARTRVAPLKRLDLALSFFPLLFGRDIGINKEPSDGRALEVLYECRELFTHPKEPRAVFPAALLVALNPALEWLIATWLSLFATCAQRSGFPVDIHLPRRRFRFDEKLIPTFEERLKPLYEASQEDEVISLLRKTVIALTDETRLALDLLNKSAGQEIKVGAPCAARNLVRTLFSDIEGSVFALASIAGGQPPKRELLSGTDEEVRERIACILENFSRELGEGVVVDRVGPEWESFSRSRRLRDHITHPHKPEDFNLEQIEWDAVFKTLSWWHIQVRGCLRLG